MRWGHSGQSKRGEGCWILNSQQCGMFKLPEENKTEAETKSTSYWIESGWSPDAQKRSSRVFLVPVIVFFLHSTPMGTQKVAWGVQIWAFLWSVAHSDPAKTGKKTMARANSSLEFRQGQKARKASFGAGQLIGSSGLFMSPNIVHTKQVDPFYQPMDVLLNRACTGGSRFIRTNKTEFKS